MLRELSYGLTQISEYSKLEIKIGDSIFSIKDIELIINKDKCVIVVNPKPECRDE